MIKTLYANGCSWTMGCGTEKDPDIIAQGLTSINVNDYAWPAHLGKLINANVINDSTGGGSNYRILRTTLDYVTSLTPEQCKETLVVIGWTLAERGELFIEDENGQNGEWYRFNAAQEFSSYDEVHSKLSRHRVKQVDKFQESYVSAIYSEDAAHTTFLQQVYLLKNTLENLGIQYLFFMALPLPEHVSKHRLYSLINADSNVIDLSHSMYAYAIENKFPLTSCFHPHTAMQRRWAEHLFNHISATVTTPRLLPQGCKL